MHDSWVQVSILLELKSNVDAEQVIQRVSVALLGVTPSHRHFEMGLEDIDTETYILI